MVTAVVFAMFFGVFADVVTPEQAMAAAEAWSAENNSAFGSGGTAVKAIPEIGSDGVVKWYAVQMSNGGCVFTSADSRIGPVLASVSDSNGDIPAGHPLYTMLSLDVKYRLETVDSVSGALRSFASPAMVSQSAEIRREVESSEEKWGKYTNGEVGKVPALRAYASATADGNPPLILGYVNGFSNKLYTHWNQASGDYSYKDTFYTFYDPIYNYYTPYHWVCGCVATLGAAIIQTFGVTNGPVAVTNTCYVNEMPTNLVTIGGEYDWSILPVSAGGEKKNMGTHVYTDAQRELLGRVTYDMGVCVGMAYSQTESGATASALRDTLVKDWGFKSADYKADYLFGLQPPDFEPLIYSQLRTGYPVGLAIASGAGGHAVMAVGYGEDRAGTAYTRIFMGWGGSSDAWYQLPTIGSYSVVNAAITLLSRDEYCVPVSGQVLLPNGLPASFAEVTVPSAPSGTVIRTGANGWFGVRIPKAAVTDEEITATLNGMTGSVTYSVSEDILDPDAFSGAVPAAMTITLSGAGDSVEYFSSPDEACAAAQDAGKVLVVLSGDNGEEKTEIFKQFFSTNDVAAFNEKFVLYYAEKDLDSYGWQDGVPSIGLFAPSMFTGGGLWLPDNGRFWYKDYTSVDIDFDELVQAMEEAYENNLDYEHWLSAQEDEVYLEVSGLTPTRKEGYVGYDMVLAGTPDTGYGIYANCYTNGEEVVITGATAMTNSVVWRCKGWIVFDSDYEPTPPEINDWYKNGEANAPWVIARGDDTEMRFSIPFEGANLEAYWLWEPVMFKVSASAKNGTIVSFNGEAGVTEGWFNEGDVVLISAVPNASPSSSWMYGFRGWNGSDDKGLGAKDVKNGTTIEVYVSGDREVTAIFDGQVTTTFLAKYALSVNAQTSAALPAGSDPLPATVAGGTVVENGASADVYGISMSIVPETTTYTDATGGVWQCVGWTAGSGSIASSGTLPCVSATLTADSSITWLWEVKAVKAFVVSEIVWSDSLDNLRTGKDYLLAEASTVPAGFDPSSLAPIAAPTGWIATPTIDPVTGNLVAEMEMNEEALKPVAVQGEPAVIKITPNSDGTVTVSANIANGLRGFWYAIYGSDSVVGPWSLVKTFQLGGTSCEQANQAEAVGEVHLSITVETSGSRQFYKVVVLESAPE